MSLMLTEVQPADDRIRPSGKGEAPKDSTGQPATAALSRAEEGKRGDARNQTSHARACTPSAVRRSRFGLLRADGRRQHRPRPGHRRHALACPVTRLLERARYSHGHRPPRQFDIHRHHGLTTFQASDQLGPGLGREAYGTCARHPEDAGSPAASHWNTAAYIFVLRSVVFGARRTRRNDTLEYKVAGGWACATRHCEQRTAAKLKTSRIDVERDRR